LVSLRPLGLSWATEDSTGFVYLISFIVAWKQRSHQIQLGHDSSTSKDINWGVIVSASKKDFRCAIPSSAYIVRKRGSGADLTCQAEICNFDCVVKNQHVFRLHVSVEKAVLMHISESEKCLVDNGLNVLLWEGSLSVLHKLVYVLLHVLKDEVEVVVNSYHFFQFYNLHVVQLAQ